MKPLKGFSKLRCYPTQGMGNFILSYRIIAFVWGFKRNVIYYTSLFSTVSKNSISQNIWECKHEVNLAVDCIM